MKVTVVGTGYVGLVSGTCFAEMGHDVTCIDIDQNKINLLKEGKSPIYEPGLVEMLTRNIEAGRLNFSTHYESVATSQAAFLAVGTPASDDGAADLTYLFQAAESMLPYFYDGIVIVIKSTVPIGTAHKLTEFLSAKTTKKFQVVNNPEFLKEGAAIADFMKPDRIVIGHGDEVAGQVVYDLYEPFVRQGNPIVMMSNLSAEMTKYAANCFLATKISFINEIATLCDATGADIEQVRKGIASDPRIGGLFLYPGPGYGGSCFPKDVSALIYTAKESGIDLKVVGAAEKANTQHKTYLFSKIQKYFNNDLNGKTFTFWGVAFKANTDDVRETAAIYMAKALIQAGAKVHFYDPIAAENFLNLATSHELKVTNFDDKYEALKNSDGLVVLTEWKEFRGADFKEIKTQLKNPVIFDGRNLFNGDKVRSKGFTYFGIGKR
jgi:UDPglucose 6-dehydrogenase